MVRGYDHLNVNAQLLLDLRLQEGTGTNTQDWAKPHHVCTLVGTPVWTNLANDVTFLEFAPGNPDYILSAAGATADLNFTAGDFSGCAWLNPDALGNRNIFTRGVAATDGFDFWLDGTGRMALSTFQAAASQFTYGTVADVAIGTWVFVGFIRDGDSVRIYTNGLDTTGTPATHINPLTAARNLYIGVNNAAGAAWYDGSIARPRIWGRALAGYEFRLLFELERGLFGV